MKAEGNKDHYVPEFYLKRWGRNNADGKLYSGKYIKQENRIVWTPRAPKGTGFERGLYGEIEEKFFKPLDDKASKTLNTLEKESIITPVKFDLGERDHINWATFILGFIVRTPKQVNFIIEGFANEGIDTITAKQQLPEIIQNEKAIKDLRSLTWAFARIDTGFELITCDNPLIFKPRNLSHPDCVIILPMGPKHFFLAARKETISCLEMNPKKMASHINAETISNMHEYFYAQSPFSVRENFILRIIKNNLTNHLIRTR